MMILEIAKMYEKEYEERIHDSHRASHMLHVEKANDEGRMSVIPSVILFLTIIVSAAIFCRYDMWYFNDKVNIVAVCIFAVINSTIAAIAHNYYEKKTEKHSEDIELQRQYRDAFWDGHNRWENIELFGSDDL